MQTNKMVALVLGMALAACGGGGGDDAGDDGGGDDGGGAGGSTCAEVLDCAAVCETDACVESCIEAGSPQAQDLIVDLANCIEGSGCQDAACLETQCGDAFDACYADFGGGGGGGGVSGDPLPDALVGTWGSSSGNASMVYTFHANGDMSYSGGIYTGVGSCDSKSVWVYDGIVHLDGNVIEIVPTSGTYTSFGCDGLEESSHEYTDVETNQWTTGIDPEGHALYLTDVSTGNTVTLHH